MSRLYALYNHKAVFHYNHRIVLCWYQTGGHTYSSYVSLIRENQVTSSEEQVLF